MIDPELQPTFTGKKINPFAMKVDDIDVLDIAHHLSQINRYNGATPYPYSVGQHAVLVCDLLRWHGANSRVQFAGLHHDDSEVWLGDVTTPIKRAELSEGYRALEWGVMRLVEAVFELPYGLTEADIVKWADNEALEREWWTLIEPDPARTSISVREMTPGRAECLFLERHFDLAGKLGVVC